MFGSAADSYCGPKVNGSWYALTTADHITVRSEGSKMKGGSTDGNYIL
jgi:hypothetical protein